MSELEAIEEHNKKYAMVYKDCENPSSKPRKRLAIVTCMDAWIHEAEAFDIDVGDAHIIRNAGASAREALRSIIVSQQVLDTNWVMVVKHTRCGMAGATNQAIADIVVKNTSVCAHHIDFQSFPELVQAVKDDVRWLRENQYMSKIGRENITGHIFRLEDGILVHVEVDGI